MSDYLLLLHGISPVSLTLEDLQVDELMVLLSLFRSYKLLHILLLPLGELEGLPHPVQLPYAVVVISGIVIVSQTVLILCTLNHDQYVHVDLRLLLFLLDLGGIRGRIYHTRVFFGHICLGALILIIIHEYFIPCQKAC